MPIRDLDPDNDYAYDKTNQSTYDDERQQGRSVVAIYVSDSGGTFTPHPTGLYQMVCCDVIDNGVCDTAYGPKHKITIRWESAEMTDKGQRMTVQQRYTATLNEKGNLRRDLEAWRGRAFTADELHKFDLEHLINANAMVNVVHRTDASGKVWANVASLAPLMKNLPKFAASTDYIRQKDRQDTPEPGEAAANEDITADQIPF